MGIKEKRKAAHAAALSEVAFVDHGLLFVRGWCAMTGAGLTIECELDDESVGTCISNQLRQDVAKKLDLVPGQYYGFNQFFDTQKTFEFGAGKRHRLAVIWRLDGHERRIDREAAVPNAPEIPKDPSSPVPYVFTEPHLWRQPLVTGRISVILAVYNGARFLRPAIDSVLRQSYQDFELVVVDDCSTDSTSVIIASYVEAHPEKIRSIRSEVNRGQGESLNVGIRAASGELSCFLDADDIWFSRKLEACYRLYESTKGRYSMYQHQLVICRGTEVTNEPFRPVLLDGDIFNYTRRERTLRLPGPFVPTSGLFFPMEIIRALYPIPLAFRICADGFLTRSAISLGRCGTLDEPLGAYRVHDDNNTIGNAAFQQTDYVDGLLIPNLQTFYERTGFGGLLPAQPASREPVMLSSYRKWRTDSGDKYRIVRSTRVNGIEDLRDRHAGRRAFIVATGPSLQMSDLTLLENEITLSCNKIVLAFDQVDWRPTYYSIIDSLVAENFNYDFSTLTCTKVFPSDLADRYGEYDNTLFVRTRRPIYREGERQFEFSTDLTEGAGGGFTVVYLLMQLAYYMGITELYLIGLDFNFEVKAVTGGVTKKGEPVIVNSGEKNHFHPDYRPDGETWTMPRLDLQEGAFRKAKEAFEADGRKIYNASRFTKLNLFDRVDFDEVIGPSQKPSTALDMPLYADIDIAVFEPMTKRILIRGWSSAPPDRVDIYLGSRWLGRASAAPPHPRRRLQVASDVFNFSATVRAESEPSQAVCIVFDFGGPDKITVSRRVSPEEVPVTGRSVKEFLRRSAGRLRRGLGRRVRRGAL